MKDLMNNKWAWAVLVLILINVATVATIWASMCCGKSRYGAAHCERGRGGCDGDHKKFHDRKGGDYLSSELNLTPEQEKTFDELRSAHMENMKTKFEAMKALKVEMAQNLGKTEAETESIFQKMGALEIEIQKATFDHFNKLYAICSDSQKVQLKEKLSSAVSFRDGAGHRGHGRYGSKACCKSDSASCCASKIDGAMCSKTKDGAAMCCSVKAGGEACSSKESCCATKAVHGECAKGDAPKCCSKGEQSEK
jgi:Spy/CpxP family protein refolding chaperone